MLRRKGMQLGLRGALVGGGPRWWALTVLVPLLCGAVPILLVNSVLRDVKGDVATWQSQIAQLTDKAAQYAAEQADVESRVGQLKEMLRSASTEAEATSGQLRTMQKGECGLSAMAKRHRAELQQLVQDITRTTQQELAELARTAKQEATAAVYEQRELEARTPETKRRTEELRQELKWTKREVQVGRALVDNDPIYLQSFLGRLTAGVDSYTGSYMLNAADCPLEGQPLMMPKAQTLTDDSLGEVTEDLLQVLPRQDPFIKPSRVVYDSCAVVGSSGMHLFHRRGDFIDSHEAVIRFNAAPTAGFEEFVGSKTTVRFVNRLHFGFQERPSEAVLQQVTTPEVLQEFIAQKREMPAQKLFMVSPDFHRYVVRQLASPPTNGLYGVFFALQRCRSITLLGFVRGGDLHVPYHYFDTDAPVTNQRRRDLQEWPLILEIARSSPGRVRMADPCQTEEQRTGSEPCEACPAGSTCQPGSGLPVALPGHCMESGRADCFYACVDAHECPGYANATVCDGRRHLEECAEL